MTEEMKLLSIGVTIEEDYPVDVLKATITIKGDRDTKQECAEAYNAHLREVRSELSAMGIPEDDVRNRDFHVRTRVKRLYEKREYDRYYEAATELDGYSFEAHLDVRCEATSEMAKRVWTALVRCGDEVAFCLHFYLKDYDAAKKGMLARAVAEGRERADLLAAAAGARVTGIHSIEYEYLPYDNYHESGMYGDASAPISLSDAPEFNPEDISLSCTVQMQWRMEAV